MSTPTTGSRQLELLRYLRTSPGGTPAALARYLGVDPDNQSFRAALRSAVHEGCLEVTGSTSSRKYLRVLRGSERIRICYACPKPECQHRKFVRERADLEWRCPEHAARELERNAPYSMPWDDLEPHPDLEAAMLALLPCKAREWSDTLSEAFPEIPSREIGHRKLMLGIETVNVVGRWECRLRGDDAAV
jgi:hypothetical protein